MQGGDTEEGRAHKQGTEGRLVWFRPWSRSGAHFYSGWADGFRQVLVCWGRYSCTALTDPKRTSFVTSWCDQV